MTQRLHAEEEAVAAALKQFGWSCGTEFWQRYYSDTWVFNLANAVRRLSDRCNEVALDRCVAHGWVPCTECDAAESDK